MKIRVCFVCLGNICRSPTAEGVFVALLAAEGLEGRFLVDSAGTAAYHTGERADARSQAAARRRGLDLTSRARRFDADDFERFDYVVAMDRDNRADLVARAPDPSSRTKVRLLRDFEDAADGADVPDPYYGGERGFERVLDICEAGCRGLLQHIRTEHGF